MKVGAWHHTLYANHWHYIGEIQWLIDVEMNNITLNKIHWFIGYIFHSGRIALPPLNTQI